MNKLRKAPFPPSAMANPAGETAAVGGGNVRVLNDPISILIVDDEPKNLTVLETVLDDPGYKLVRADSADQALLALVSKEFALLILDVRMPVMTGFELAHLIRQRRKTEQVPIIFLTAYYHEDQHVLEGYGTGAVDYLHKPVNPVILRSKVAIFADLHRKSRALEAANRALLAEVTERRGAQTQLRELNETLEKRVLERTEALLERTRIEAAQREQLRASEEFNRSLMEGTADGVQVLDLGGALLYVNGPGMAQLGVEDFTPLRDQPWEWLWPENARDMLRRSIEQARAGAATSFTALRPNPQGARKWWNVLVSPVRDSANGQIVQLLAVSRDVTEAHEVEQALRASDQHKDNFIATLAHELRNPLAPIRNAVSVLRRTQSTGAQLAWCRDLIDRQVSQMSRLLDDLLDVARINQSKLTLKQERLSVATILEQAVEIARPSLDAGSKRFEMTLPEEAIIVEGDLIRLAQVISNLLINAAKYTQDDGHIQLSARQERDEVVVAVKDNGIGIASEHLTQIFEMFGQVASAKSYSDGGLGIGLSLARGVAELHNGRLDAYSAGEGRGSEFILRLPVALGTSVSVPVVVAIDSTAMARHRVMVVDDSRDNADSLALLLGTMGHDVRTVYGGAQAVRTAREFRPEVAFIDLGMPDIDGYEVCRQIRAQLWSAGMVLVAQTGWGQELDRRRTQAAGFDQHLVKPLASDVLDAVLRRIGRRANDE